jgi:hypothetical protein
VEAAGAVSVVVVSDLLQNVRRGTMRSTESMRGLSMATP